MFWYPLNFCYTETLNEGIDIDNEFWYPLNFCYTETEAKDERIAELFWYPLNFCYTETLLVDLIHFAYVLVPSKFLLY